MKILCLFFMISLTNILLAPPKINQDDNGLVKKCKAEITEEISRFDNDLGPDRSFENLTKKWAAHFLKIEQIHNAYGCDVVEKAQMQREEERKNKK